MRRREFITLLGGTVAGSPLCACVQPVMPVIGFISSSNSASPGSEFERLLTAFRKGLNERGYVEGQNIAFEYRDAEGDVDRLPGLAAELIRLDVDVIVTSTDLATRAAKGATTKIPILMVAINYDPIALGYIDSIARPGANVTGLSTLAADLEGKRIELLKELLANLARVASWWHTDGDLNRPIECFTDMTRSRQRGFAEYVSTLDSFSRLFTSLRKHKIIP